MMLKLPVLQNFKIKIGKHFCMNTSCMSGTQQHLYTVTCDCAESSSKLLSMSRQTRPEQCITTVFKNKSSQQKIHIQFLVQ